MYKIIGMNVTWQSEKTTSATNSICLFKEAPTLDESDSDSLEADNSKFEQIYTNGFSDDEIGFYAIEVVSNRGVPP